MKILLTTLLLASIPLGCTGSTPEIPQVHQGVLDLRHWDFTRDGPIEINGEWHFWWEQLLGPEHSSFATGSMASSSYSRINSNWAAAHSRGDAPFELNAYGMATYAVEVWLPEKPSLQPVAIWGESQGTLTRVFFWSENPAEPVQESQIGIFSEELGEWVPWREHYHLSLGAMTQFRRARIVLQVANRHHARGGPWEPLTIGQAASGSQSQWRTLLRDSLVLGVLLLASVYHFILFGLRREDWVSFWFATFCGALLLRSASTSLLAYEWIGVPSVGGYTFLKRLEWAGMPLAALSGVMFFKALIPQMGLGRWQKPVVLLAVPLWLGTWLAPVQVFTMWLPVHHSLIVLVLGLIAVGLVKGIAAGVPVARVTALAFTALAATAVNDMLHGADLIDTEYLTAYGLVVFILVQSALIAHEASRAFRERDEGQQKLLESYAKIGLETVNRIALEDEKAKLQQASKGLAEQLIEADKLASLGSLVAGVAHEIASPVTCIRAGLDSLTHHGTHLENVVFSLFEDEDSGEAQEVRAYFTQAFDKLSDSAKSIDLGASRIAAINGAIRNQSRIDLEPSFTQMRTLIDECTTILAHKLFDIEVSVACETSIRVFCRRSHIGQVMTNLLANAADVCSESKAPCGRIQMTAISEVGGVRVSVEDNGPGVPIALREKILEPFFTTKEVGQGTGLGMPICARIVEEHGGALVIDDSVSLQGARFSFVLPTQPPSDTN